MMMEHSHFITEESEFNAIRERMTAVFDTTRRFPEQVFNQGFEGFAFVEFTRMFWTEFWNALQQLAFDFGDKEIYVFTYNPDPDEFYRENSRYSALRFDVAGIPADYSEALNETPPTWEGGGLIDVCYDCAWCGDSMQWGFFGMREEGIGVGATRIKHYKWPVVDDIFWFQLDDEEDKVEILKHIIHLEYGQSEAADEAFNAFYKQLQQNYEE
ncbi:MAG: hypothetical protein ACYC5A_10460 [Thermoleophilia bacterium]